MNSVHFGRGEKEEVSNDEWQVESDGDGAGVWEMEMQGGVVSTQVKGRLKQM